MHFLRALCSFAVKNGKSASTAKTQMARTFRKEFWARQLFLILLSAFVLSSSGWAQMGQLNNLAERFGQLYRDGSYAEAEKTAQEILSLLEKTRGEQDLDVAASLNNLGSMAYSQGRLGDAETWYQRSLQIHQAVVGELHLNVADVLYNLAGLYTEQGKYDRAESLYQQSLKIRQALLGDGDPLAADVLNNLGILYLRQSKYQLADQALGRAWQIWQKHFGADSAPFAAITLNNLAMLRARQKRFAEAESLYKQALAIEERFWGNDHPERTTTLLNLAELHRAQGKIEDAVRLHQQAVAILKKTLGQGHPLTSDLEKRLGELSYKAGGQNAARLVGGADPLGVYQIILVKTKREAEELIKRIREGEKFDDLAVAYSIDPSAANRGYFKAKISDLREELRRQLEQIRVGEVSAVFEFNKQWAIVKRIQDPR